MSVEYGESQMSECTPLDVCPLHAHLSVSDSPPILQEIIVVELERKCPDSPTASRKRLSFAGERSMISR